MMRIAHIQNMSKVMLKIGLLSLLALTAKSWAHNTESHAEDRRQAQDQGVMLEQNQSEITATLPLDFGGEFELIDHYGKTVTNKTYLGKYMLVFFGYANCRNMCSMTLSRIGKTLELLGEDVKQLNSVIVTVDPIRDTPLTMKTDLAKYHPNLIGHTGNSQQLNTIYNAYHQKVKSAGNDWNNDPIISHSSYLFLMDIEGNFSTLLPPILNPQSMADIIGKHLKNAT